MVSKRVSRRATAAVAVGLVAISAIVGTALTARHPEAGASIQHRTGGAPPVAGATATPTVTAPAVTNQGTPGKRPNIVFVLTDDLSMNLLPYLPGVQQLQRAGTTLSKYYVVDSLCCPSRTAIFTGEYPHNNGVFTNGGADGGYDAYNAHGDAQKSFAVSVQRAGYRTAFMGKYLNGYQPTDPVPPGWDTWNAVGYGYDEFDYDMNVDGRVQHFGHTPSDYLTDVLSRRAGDYIRSAATSSQPFLLEVSTFAPHGPAIPAQRYAAAYRGLAYTRTPAFARAPSAPPPWLANRRPLVQRNAIAIDRAFTQRVRASLALSDLVEHLRATLQASGVAQDTYLIFSSDNGFHMGEYRLMPGKQTAFDTDIHVPLIVSGPGVPAGRVEDRLASNIDLAPTFETLAGARVPSTVDGVSLVPLWHGTPTASWQQGVLVEHHRPPGKTAGPDTQPQTSGMPPTYWAVRTGTGLYVRYDDGSTEYYDTAADPFELANLGRAGVPPAVSRMLTALRLCRGTASCQRAAGR